MSNPFDLLAIAQDVIRREEAELLHRAVHDAHKEASGDRDADRSAYLRGLEEAMLIIDARIGHLRDRWG